MTLRSKFSGSLAVLVGISLISCDRTDSSARAQTNSAVVQEPASDDSGPPKSEESGAEQVTIEQFEQTYDELGRMYQEMARDHGDSTQPMAWQPGAMGQMQRQMEQMAGRCRGMMGRDQQGMMGHDQQGMMGHDRRGKWRDQNRGMMRGQRGRWMNEEWMMANPAMAQWHQQMARQNMERAEQLEKANEDQRAQTHREVAKKHQEMAGMMSQMSVGQAAADQDGDAGEAPTGREIFATMCASCHGDQGQGTPGAFPPLAGNSVVTGPQQRLIRIVQEGLTGPLDVDGQTYFGTMPSFQGRLSQAQFAAVLTYIRSAWQNDASAVSVEEIEKATVEGRQRPWTTDELGLAPSD